MPIPSTLSSGSIDIHSCPVYLVPDDVLLEVFKLCIDNKRPTFNKTKTTIPEAFLLAQVCCHWRNVAYSLPGLWNKMSVQRTDLTDSALKMLGEALQRSRSLPVDFDLRMSQNAKRGPIDKIKFNLQWMRMVTGSSQYFHQQLKEIAKMEKMLPPIPHHQFLWDLLRPVASNLTRLSLIDVRIHALVSLPARAFPNLQRLVLGISTPEEWITFNWAVYGDIKAFAHSPSALTHVALRRDHRSKTHHHRIRLPYDQLTHFVDYCPSAERSDYFFQEILPTCTANLRNLTVFVGKGDLTGGIDLESWAKVKKKSKLPALECLNIESSAFGYPGFIEFLDMPNLRRLRLTKVDLRHTALWFNNPPANPTLEFPGRFAHLDELSLVNIDWFSTRTIVATLEGVPRVRSFEMTLAEETLMLLTRGRFGECCVEHVSDAEYDLLPNLQVLKLRYMANPASDEPFDRMDMRHLQMTLVRLITSRIGKAVPEAKGQMPRSAGLTALHLMWHGYKRSKGLNPKDPVLRMLRGVAVTAMDMDISVDDLKWPTLIMDSLVRDEGISSWIGVQDLVREELKSKD